MFRLRTSFYQRVWAWVSQVPRGRVVTYGQVASALGQPRAARAVGYAMFNTPDPSIPWQRVINSKGEISEGGQPHRPALQRRLLRAEGVLIDRAGRIDLRRYRWSPVNDRGARAPTRSPAR